jgi:hypothetical protein
MEGLNAPSCCYFLEDIIRLGFLGAESFGVVGNSGRGEGGNRFSA